MYYKKWSETNEDANIDFNVLDNSQNNSISDNRKNDSPFLKAHDGTGILSIT